MATYKTNPNLIAFNNFVVHYFIAIVCMIPEEK